MGAACKEKFMKRRRILIPLVLLLTMLIFVAPVEATDGMRGVECRVEPNEVITEDFYFLCNTLVVEGLIDGDMIGVASEVTIERGGRVMGQVWMVGGNLTIEGTVGNDVHFLGVDLDVPGLARFPEPTTDIVAATLSLEVGRDVVLPGDVVFWGYQAVLNGKINGDVDFQGQALIINNTIAGRVDASIGDSEGTAPLSNLPLVYSVNLRNPGLRFGEEGYITGDLNYEAPQRAGVNDDVIGGQIRYSQPITQTPLNEIEEPETFWQVMGNYILRTARDVTALGLVGMIVLNFLPVTIKEPGFRVQTKPISAFSWGLILFLLSIPASLLLLLTSIFVALVVFILTFNELTLMVSVLLLILNLSFLGGFFFLIVFVGRVISSFVIGFVILRRVQLVWRRYGDPPRATSELWLAIIIGVILVSLLINLPLGVFVGYLQLAFTGIIALAGFGSLFMYLRDLWYFDEQPGIPLKRLREGGNRPVVPPPPDDMDYDMDVPLGMDNLPPGFKGFDE
jgi:hypothetical protein